jgi:hypothetical protein
MVCQSWLRPPVCQSEMPFPPPGVSIKRHPIFRPPVCQSFSRYFSSGSIYPQGVCGAGDGGQADEGGRRERETFPLAPPPPQKSGNGKQRSRHRGLAWRNVLSPTECHATGSSTSSTRSTERRTGKARGRSPLLIIHNVWRYCPDKPSGGRTVTGSAGSKKPGREAGLLAARTSAKTWPISGGYQNIERTPDMARRSKPGSDFVVWGHCTISMKAQVWRRPSSRESITLAHSPPHRRPRLVPV